MRKLLLEMSSDLGKCPNYKTHESESGGFIYQCLKSFLKAVSHKALYSYCKKNIVVRSRPYICHRIFFMDLVNVGGYFTIRSLKIVRTVHICPLKIPSRRTRSVCKRTHWYPYPTLALMV